MMGKRLLPELFYINMSDDRSMAISIWNLILSNVNTIRRLLSFQFVLLDNWMICGINICSASFVAPPQGFYDGVIHMFG